jgi:hypothetical protein
MSEDCTGKSISDSCRGLEGIATRRGVQEIGRVIVTQIRIRRIGVAVNRDFCDIIAERKEPSPVGGKFVVFAESGSQS